MIINDPVKKKIKNQYIESVLFEKIKVSEAREIKEKLINAFNTKNRKGIVRLVDSDTHKDAVELTVDCEDVFLASSKDKLLQTLVEKRILDKVAVKDAVNEVVNGFLDEDVSSIDFSNLDDENYPCLLYLEYIDPKESN